METNDLLLYEEHIQKESHTDTIPVMSWVRHVTEHFTLGSCDTAECDVTSVTCQWLRREPHMTLYSCALSLVHYVKSCEALQCHVSCEVVRPSVI